VPRSRSSTNARSAEVDAAAKSSSGSWMCSTSTRSMPIRCKLSSNERITPSYE
jgi:hypothetical protein